MKALRSIQRMIAAAVVALSIGLAMAPQAHAAVTPVDSGHSAPVFGDGNESHGKG